MVIYADVVFIVNFISTFTLLVVYSAVFGGEYKVYRKVLSSAFSGLYAVFENVLGLPIILRPATAFLIIIIAFGKSGFMTNTLRFMFVCVCIESVFAVVMTILGYDAYISGGTVTVFSGDVFGMFIYAASYPIFFTVRLFLGRRSQKRRAEITIDGCKVNLTLLYDSGNLLTFKGKGVAVVSYDSLKDVLNYKDYDEFKIKAEERMIFNTVSCGGIMPVIYPQKTITDGMKRDIYIAVTNRKFKNCDGVIGDIKT